MKFEIIGANTENYYLICFDEEFDICKGVFFYKILIDYFSGFIFERDDVIDILIDIELFIEDMYESLIDNGILKPINYEDSKNINITFGDGGVNDIINR